MSTGEPLAGISSGGLHDVRPRHLVIRFAFGATVSAVAAVLVLVVGPRFAGIFLAFPAILPATLTLIEENESTWEAKDDDVGAILGTSSLLLFGAITWWLVPAVGAAPALVVASVGWLMASGAQYLALRLVRLQRGA